MSLLGCPSLKSAWACSWGLVGDDISTLTCHPGSGSVGLSVYLDLLYLSIYSICPAIQTALAQQPQVAPAVMQL